MSRKHFEAIAKILKNARGDAIANGEAPMQVSDVALELADYFSAQNSNFDRTRFMTACGF